MKWGWPEEAYAIWRVGSVQARGRQELSAGKTRGLQPSQERRRKGGQGGREGKWKGEAEARLCSEVGCLDLSYKHGESSCCRGFNSLYLCACSVAQ